MGPSPQELLAASLASCTAITIEMYAKRKKWNIDGLEVDSTTRPPSAAARRTSSSSCGCPPTSPRTRSRGCSVIAAKCPVHRTLEGEVFFDERVELA